MRKILFLLLIISFVSFGQDSTEIKKKGKLSGQWRTYYLATANEGNLKDFQALASGGKLNYTYKALKGLQIGAALYNTVNLGLQDLETPDAATGRINRYEEGLFDRLNLNNDAVFILGELYASYKLRDHALTVGRMKINTPLINPQDGRMIPTLVQGAWYAYKTKTDNRYQFGFLNAIAPRSTGQFFGIGESIGTYPLGRNTLGQPSQYANNTNSDFVVLLNADVKLTDKLQLGFWNYYTDNIFNNLYLRPRLNLGKGFGLQGEWLHQTKIGVGGNEQEALRYFNQNSSDMLGLKFEYVFQTSKIALSYNRILPNGQFIFPREWGREDFFSFQKRERSEGTADNHALVFYYDTQFNLFNKNTNIRSIFSVGRHWKPTVTNAVLNKYALPDYTHVNLDFFFNFIKLTHLKPELLLTAKIAGGDVPDNPNFFLNKVDMYQVNFILNYNF